MDYSLLLFVEQNENYQPPPTIERKKTSPDQQRNNTLKNSNSFERNLTVQKPSISSDSEFSSAENDINFFQTQKSRKLTRK